METLFEMKNVLICQGSQLMDKKRVRVHVFKKLVSWQRPFDAVCLL